ncbi:MAG: hypothetical protein HYY31_00415 [Chloroflexi bacterium]|nr:hypothetical protein [Chloroflexota bacterium]
MRQNANHRNTHSHRLELLSKPPQEITEEVLGKTRRGGVRFWMVVAVLGVLFVLGIVGFIIRLGDGVGDRRPWGYLAAALAFLITTGMSAPLASIAPRFARAHWCRPVSRAAELWAVVGILCTLMLIPLLFVLPTASDRSSIWFVNAYREGWPPGAPHAWLLLAVLFLTICGLALLWTGAIPDLAAAKDRATGWRKTLSSILAMRWQGTVRQWRIMRVALGVLGGLYFMFLVYVHALISSDLAMSLVPGWKDSVFPAFHALSGLQSAMATTLVTLFLLRTFGGLKEYIFVDQFWSASKLLLATSILWFYFWWSGFITYWYGRTPAEHAVLTLLMFGPYKPIFITTFVLNFVLPLFLLIWNAVRKSILGPTLVSCSILVGTFLDRIRLYVASFSVEDSTGHLLGKIPGVHYPDVADVLMLIGAVAGAVLLYMLATRLIPIINIWEAKEGVLLQRVQPFHKTQVKVLAKPE